MRQIVFDTETTGLEPSQGHRVIEIGAVELFDRKLTQNHFHFYLNPDREIDWEAMAVHGISNEFLADKPRFEEIVDSFLNYIKGAELIAHNAAFDVGFLNAELQRYDSSVGRIEDHATVLDSLMLARKMHPGMKNSLDALCKRYEVDNSKRELHGALLDAELLADVYLLMTGGQTSLSLKVKTQQQLKIEDEHGPVQKQIVVVNASSTEISDHEERLDELEKASGQASLWRRVGI